MKWLSIFTLFILLTSKTFAQENGDQWPAIPGMDENGFAVKSTGTFLGVFGAAVISYGLGELFGKDEKLHFYQFRAGAWGTTSGTVLMENFGVERRVTPWFGISAEVVNQQYFSEGYGGAGMGFSGYYRWYLFGRKRLSPFMEHGTGVFWGFNKFPQDGSNFTFHLTSSLGLEYTMKNENKIRATYGHIHQSNNDLRPVNPGMDGNGFSVTYLWSWKKGKQRRSPLE